MGYNAENDIWGAPYLEIGKAMIAANGLDECLEAYGVDGDDSCVEYWIGHAAVAYGDAYRVDDAICLN